MSTEQHTHLFGTCDEKTSSAYVDVFASDETNEADGLCVLVEDDSRCSRLTRSFDQFTYARSHRSRLAVVSEKRHDCFAKSHEQFIVRFTHLSEEQRRNDGRQFPFGFVALFQTCDQLLGQTVAPSQMWSECEDMRMCEGSYRFATSSGMYFCKNNACSVFKAFSRVFKLNESNVRSSPVPQMYLLLVAQPFDGRFEFFIEIVRRQNDFARRRHAR